MNSGQAKDLIRETFTQGFDKPRFHRFIKELLNHIDESKASAWNSQYVKDAFKDHVARYERLGTYTSPEKEKLDVLIVHLTEDSKIERARTAIRNFVADHLKTRDEKDAALVAFVSPTEKQWRFSYVKMEYAAVEQESGKVGIKTRLTPARRCSYLVGEGESCHTAQTRFLNLLQETSNDPSIGQIEEAFSVESVTKEFFEKYKALFLDLKEELDRLGEKDKAIGKEFLAKKINTVDFAKKLMGQIVFLYFLQKKGWLGVARGQEWGAGPRDFLRRLAKGDFGKYDNFFNDVLEELFYDTLATDRGHEAWCLHFKCRIPFLNGGLFEPLGDYDWQSTHILIPNELFTNQETTSDGDIGTGILDVFDRYNFTVQEDEPLEKEVAIDPEMLGKVFENLLEVKERKSKGSFYTPREVVHYMCQESLINYLDTAINGREESNHEVVSRTDIERFIHQGDQAAYYEAARKDGTKSYRRELPKSIDENSRSLDNKLKEITVCDPAVGSGAFLVGMMNEIVRARFALTPYFNDVHERTAYRFKHDAIQNCLYGVDIDPGATEIAKLRLWLSLVVDEEDVKQIKPLPNLDYKIVAGDSLFKVEKTLFNEKAFRRLEELKPLYFDESQKKKKDSYKKEIDKLIHEITNGMAIFDFEVYFSEVFHKRNGFDICIGNPPYIFSRDNLTSKDKAAYKKIYKLTQFKINLYILFIEKAFHVANNFGTASYIVPNNWLTLATNSDLRRFLLEETYDIRITLNYDKVFENANVDTCVLLFNKWGNKKISGYEWNGNGVQLLRCYDSNKYLSRDGHIIGDLISKSTKDLGICEKINSMARPLSDYADVKNGVQAYTVGEGDPIQTEEMKEKRIYHSKNQKDNSWIKYLDGVDVIRYQIGWSGEFIKYGKNLTRPREAWLFEGERLLVRQIPGRPPYCIHGCYTEQHTINDNNSMIVKIRSQNINAKYILALINSKLLSFWFVHSFGKLQRKIFPQFKVKELRIFPIKYVEPAMQKPFISIVDKILLPTSKEDQAKVKDYEQTIDQMVYVLYGLTKDEIKLVEDIQ